jgi:rod shape determining protein RodA
MINRRNTWQNIDWLLMGGYFLLVSIGWIAVYAAGYDFTNSMGGFFNQVYGRQFIWLMISAFFALAILITDNKFYTEFAYYIYGFMIFLLFVALFAGATVKGSHSWINLGFFQLQPAEFTKFATALALSKYLSSLNLNFKLLKTWGYAIAVFMVPCAIIILQNETGSALVFFVFFLVIYRFGFNGLVLLLGVIIGVLTISALIINKYYLILGIATICGLGIYFLRKQRAAMLLFAGVFVIASMFVLATDYFYTNVLETHQKQRIDVFLGKEVKIKDADYNVRQSKIAIGSGGLLGKGFLQGTLTKFNFVPEQTTDFIFCTIGEEYGFWGSSLVLIIFLAFISRVLFIAERQRSKFSRIYAYAVACILFFHVLINIGMTMGLMPIIGIPLPLISYGGSSLLATTILIFILIKLDADRLSVLR